MLTETEIERLAPKEKLLLIRRVWASFVANPESLPVSEHEKQELERRSREHRVDPTAALSEKVFNQRLKQRLARGK
ncbi:MAG: addiction module protein [Verrucomicrobia bacterium]|nr:addiction module protein [Verrucomicrobiota bacterium]